MSGEPWRVPARDVASELVIKRSRFVTTLRRVPDAAGAAAVIAAVRKEHWQATHNCTALIVGDSGEVQRSSDDGEPAGTAGVPMLEVLRAHTMTQSVVVVTRYFGGVKLGAGGLVRAYSGAVSDAVARAGLLRLEPAVRLRVTMSPSDVGRAEHLLREWGDQLRVEAMEYSPGPAAIVLVPATTEAAVRARLADLGSGKWTVDAVATSSIELPD